MKEFDIQTRTLSGLLNKGHRAFQCRSKALCLECKRNHNVSICDIKSTNALPSVELNRNIGNQAKESDLSLVNSTINATSCISSVEYGGRAVLQTALAVAVLISNGKYIPLYFAQSNTSTAL